MARPPRLPILGPRRRPINAGSDPEPAAPAAPAEQGAVASPPRKPEGTGQAGNGIAQPPPGPEGDGRRIWPAAIGGLILIAAVAGVLLSVGVIGGGETEDSPAPVPIQTTTVPSEDESAAAAAAAELGFPTFATKNTTRVGGADPVDNAAAAALATFPATGEGARPDAVTVANADDWPTALAAAVLTAEPISSPILLGYADRLPEATEQALTALDPEGSDLTGGSEVFAVGGVQVPASNETNQLAGGTPAQTAALLARTRAELTGTTPAAYLLVSDTEPGFAMPAAAWAARSGNPILFGGSDLPKATRDLLAENRRVPVYVLGPDSVIPDSVLQSLRQDGHTAQRVAGADPVANAIAFSRYSDGEFGWNINDPGHGLVIARSDRPLDAAAAAPLSAAGTWGPLLLTDAAQGPPAQMRSYLLDIKPGYRTDPTRALYNHVWVIGDQNAIDLAQQATLDQLAELERIGPDPAAPAADQGATGPDSPQAPGQSQDPEQEPEDE